ncbi:hypothetical protein GCM10023205_82330 [Yinghuangia aomiensis]|uniref:Uncharacterized protein n=1 Tax=Yinghuangia aomiensis TaxID=676205 RepID=A0ABP9IFE9_9ACTN
MADVLEVGGKVAGDLDDPGAGRVRGDAEQSHAPGPWFDDEGRVSRLSVTVSTWKKSTARNDSACARRNVRQVSSRRPGGETPRARRTFRIVDAAARWPRRPGRAPLASAARRR